MSRFAVTEGLGAAVRRLPVLSRRLSPPPSGPRKLRTLLEALGGSFIKFGQVLALQPDILPRAYCDELLDLMDRMPPFDIGDVEKLIRQELGKNPEEIFDSFEETPIASASIAQVHVAWLDGRKLAVKVQRPNARREFGGDILLMKWAIYWIGRLRLNRLEWLARTLGEFISWTGEELDFMTEARFMDQLAFNSRDRETERVPEVEWQLTTGRILTCEFLEGTTLLQYLRSLDEGDPTVGEQLRSVGFEPERFAENALENFFHDVFHRGVFHADLHPANLLILPDNAVGYVDFGISGVVSEYSRYHLVGAVLALTRGDVRSACDSVLAICDLEPDSDPAGLRRAFEEAGDRWYRRVPGERRFEKSTTYTEILLDSLWMSRRFKTFVHPEGIRYMRSVITLDGLIGRFAPDLDRDRTLERESSGLLETTALSTSLAFDRWVDWLSAASRLVRDGSARMDRVLDRLERRADPRSSPEPSRPSRSREREARALHLGMAAIVLTVLAVVLGEPPRLGLNLFTAELTVIGCSLGLLIRELLRWRPSRR